MDKCLPLSPVPDDDSVPENSVVLRQAVPHERDIWDIWGGDLPPLDLGEQDMTDDLPHDEQPHKCPAKQCPAKASRNTFCRKIGRLP